MALLSSLLHFYVTRIKSGGKFNIRFKVNRYPTMCMHRALEIISLSAASPFWSRFLFPTPELVSKAPSLPSIGVEKFINPLIAQNEEQKSAVNLKNKIAGSSYTFRGFVSRGSVTREYHSVSSHGKNHALLQKVSLFNIWCEIMLFINLGSETSNSLMSEQSDCSNQVWVEDIL